MVERSPPKSWRTRTVNPSGAGPPQAGKDSRSKSDIEVKIMYYVYVILSLSDGMHYTGSTSKGPTERLKEHNAGCNRWTKGHKPFKLLYFEEASSKAEALKKEKFLKSGAGRKFIDSIVK